MRSQNSEEGQCGARGQCAARRSMRGHGNRPLFEQAWVWPNTVCKLCGSVSARSLVHSSTVKGKIPRRLIREGRRDHVRVLRRCHIQDCSGGPFRKLHLPAHSTLRQFRWSLSHQKIGSGECRTRRQSFARRAQGSAERSVVCRCRVAARLRLRCASNERHGLGQMDAVYVQSAR